MSPHVSAGLQTGLSRLLGQEGGDILGLGFLLTLGEFVRHQLSVGDQPSPSPLGLHGPITVGIAPSSVHLPPPPRPSLHTAPESQVVVVTLSLEMVLEVDL